MGTHFAVRRLREGDWESFRALRLESLRSDPLAFGSTLRRESEYPAAKWQDWCRRGAEDPAEATFVAVDLRGEFVGMAGAFTQADTPHVWGMWVHPAWRRQGVAKRLMRALMRWVDDLALKNPVLLDVNPSQEAAVRLYTWLGFAFTGVEAPLGHDPPAIVRQMARRPTVRGRGERRVRSGEVEGKVRG